ncbi:MAG: dienelactone hydrolase family protein [Candidatus Abyssubacteria bacterium]
MQIQEMDHEVSIGLKQVNLPGILRLPKGNRSLVIFAHGSGSSRLSTRNNFVAETLEDAGIGSLLFDLLTEKEDMIYENRFNIELIADRLVQATNWALNNDDMKNLAMGYFGASTGAAAALKAAVKLKHCIKAVVSRGGRPDLAPDALPEVEAPTLLIVGGRDTPVIEMNRSASERMKGTRELAIVRGATHLFEERGALEEVARLATEWFKKYLV